MQIRIKKENKDGIVRLQSSGQIKEVEINEDLLHPEEESISLYFRGKSSSGIVDLSPEEFEQLYFTIRKRMHLIKGFRRLSNGGAMVLGNNDDARHHMR